VVVVVAVTLFLLTVHDGVQLALLETVVFQNFGTEVKELLTVGFHVQAFLGLEVHAEKDLKIG
jgi:hypothetical protein